MKKQTKVPAMRLHKASNQAIFFANGRIHYLGKFGTDEANKRYHELLAKYLANPDTFGIEKARPSVAECVVAFLKHSATYYADSEYQNLRRAMEPLIELFPSVRMDEFGIPELKTVREWWRKRGAARTYVNRQSNRVLQLANWLAAEGMVNEMLHYRLKRLEPLKAGRCDLEETDPVLPVDDELVEKTLPFLTEVVADMIRLQRVLGCRPGEIVQLKPCMVDCSKAVWIINVEKHKNAWRKQKRHIFVGPQGQAVLQKYLTRKPDQFCFSPSESEEQRLKARESKRTVARSCGNVRGSNRRASPKRKPGDCYTTGTYGKAIASACKRGKIEHWTPNQIRHAVATKLAEKEGLESAALILGNKSISTTENYYVEKSKKRAVEVAAKHL